MRRVLKLVKVVVRSMGGRTWRWVEVFFGGALS